MRRIFTLLLFAIVSCINSYGLNVTIITSGSYNMANNWDTIATRMGHTATIVAASTLDDTTFFAGSDLLIIPSGIATYSAAQIAVVQEYIEAGKSVYFQAEYNTVFSSNLGCSTIISNLGSSFSWTGTVSGNLSPHIFGSLSVLEDTATDLSYFYYGATATHSCNVMAFMIGPNWEPVGWMFRPATAAYGRLIFTTDQDWINSGLGTAAVEQLMTNIIDHLADASYGDQDPVLLAETSLSSSTICSGTSATFSLKTVNGGATPTYQWYKNGATVGTGINTYTDAALADGDKVFCAVTGSAECNATGNSDTITMTVKLPITAPPVVLSPVTYCAGVTASAMTATAASGDTLIWYYTATGGTGTKTAPTPSTASPGDTVFYVSQRNVCEGPRDSITVTINALPAAPAGDTDRNYCVGAAAMALTATATSASDTLKWYAAAAGGTGTTIATIPSTAAAGATSYYVGQTNIAGCEGPRDTIVVQVNAIPGTPGVISPVVYCQGDTAIALSATGSSGDTLRWYTTVSGDTAVLAPTPSTAVAGSTTWYVSQVSAAGCEGPRDSIVVTIHPAPAAPTVSTPVNICIGAATAALTATATSASDTLKWYTAPGDTASLTAPVPSSASTGLTPYYVTQTNAYGCESPQATINVRIRAKAAKPTVTTPVTYCMGATATALTAAAGSSTDTLLWYTSIGGTASKTAPVPSTSATGTTDYYVSGKTSFGCEGNTAIIKVKVNPVAATPAVTTPVTYCQNATAAALSATAGSSADTLLWYTSSSGGTGNTTAPTPATSSSGTTNYYVSAKTTLGCEGSRANLKVVVNPAAATPAVTTPVNYCIGAAATALTAKPGSTTDTLLWYNVSGGGTGTQTAPTPATTPVGSTTYYVSGKTNLGCEGNRAAITVSVRPLATTPAVTSPVYYCLNTETVALTATPGGSTDTLLWYTLSSGGSGTKTAPKPLSATAGSTVYYVSGKTSFGCEGSRAALTVTINPLPVVTVSSLSPTIFIVCRGGPAVLLQANAPTATVYQWYYKKTLLTGAVMDTISAADKGFWVAEVTDANGCKARDSVFIQPDTSATPVLTSVYNTICAGTSVNLTCSPGLSTNRFKWFKDALVMPGVPLTWHILPASETGVYKVEVTNKEGCMYTTDESTVDFYPALPKPVIINTTPVLSVSGSYLFYQWFRNSVAIRGATGSTYTMLTDGDYSVVVTGAYGCRDTSDIEPVHGLMVNEQTDATDISIYPNPTPGKLVIESPADVQVTVTDINGRMVLQSVQTKSIDLSSFADGLYLVYIRDTDGRLVKVERVHKSAVQH